MYGSGAAIYLRGTALRRLPESRSPFVRVGAGCGGFAGAGGSVLRHLEFQHTGRARGNLVSKNPIQRIVLKSKGISTIGGKDLWFDEDINRLNEDSRGRYLGQFNTGDHILAVFKDGTYYTTSFDLSNRYQGEILFLEKFDPSKIFTAIYYDGAQKWFYVKRFSFELSDNTPVSFISSTKGSYLACLSEDRYPRFEVTFGGKYAHREPETVNAEEFIAKKGIAAKCKKASQYDIASIKFVEPLRIEEEEEKKADEFTETVSDAVPEEPETIPDAGSEDNQPTLF